MSARVHFVLGAFGVLAACAPPSESRSAAATDEPADLAPSSPAELEKSRTGPIPPQNAAVPEPTPEEVERYLGWLIEDDAAAEHDMVWRPAETPPGGTSWALLESTEEITRVGDDGFIRSRPVFPPQVAALEGERITVAGWMMPLENGARQRRFVLLAYPPGCPFHLHALPYQFIEVLASEPVRLDEVNVIAVSGVLELTGEDESGIFYKLHDARGV